MIPLIRTITQIVKTQQLKNISRVIAVTSAKGGVGKSTVATNIAIALSKNNKVGLLDCDLYGPSIPRMLGITNTIADANVNSQHFVPIKKHGIKAMSLGLIMSEKQPVAWRGLMALQMVQKLLFNVDWGKLDFLVLDMPPGTGDISITTFQSVIVNCTIVVTTPQMIALADTIRGIEFLKKMDVPILGIVENMSLITCEKCHHENSLGAGKEYSEQILASGLDIIAQLPMLMDIARGSDIGEPIALNASSAVSRKFYDLANLIIAAK